MSKRAQKLSNQRRQSLSTRANELRELRARKDAELAELIAERLKPFVADEIARQLIEREVDQQKESIDEMQEKTA